MVVPEALVVGAVPRLVDIEERDHEPGSLVVATDAARGLDVLGVRLRLTEHDHQPEARDVEAHGDHVRRDRAVDPLLDLVEWRLESAARLGHLVGRNARGEFDHLGEVLAVLEEPSLFADPLAASVGLDRILDLLLEDPARPAQLAQAVEVAEHRHIRVGGVLLVLVPAGVAVGALGGAHQGEPRLAHDDFRVPALRGDSEIKPCRRLRRGNRPREERVAPVGPGRREHLRQWPREERLDLVLRPAHGGGRGDDLGPHRAPVNLAHAQRLDRGLVEPGHRAERSRDQVQLVLDHEVGRRERRGEARALARLRGSIEARRVVPLRPTEQRPGLPDPRERCEFVDRRDQEGREPPVDRLVHGHDGERPVAREVAFEVRADDAQLARLVVVRQERERVRPEARPAPRAVLKRDRAMACPWGPP